MDIYMYVNPYLKVLGLENESTAVLSCSGSPDHERTAVDLDFFSALWKYRLAGT